MRVSLRRCACPAACASGRLLPPAVADGLASGAVRLPLRGQSDVRPHVFHANTSGELPAGVQRGRIRRIHPPFAPCRRRPVHRHHRRHCLAHGPRPPAPGASGLLAHARRFRGALHRRAAPSRRYFRIFRAPEGRMLLPFDHACGLHAAGQHPGRRARKQPPRRRAREGCRPALARRVRQPPAHHARRYRQPPLYSPQPGPDHRRIARSVARRRPGRRSGDHAAAQCSARRHRHHMDGAPRPLAGRPRPKCRRTAAHDSRASSHHRLCLFHALPRPHISASAPGSCRAPRREVVLSDRRPPYHLEPGSHDASVRFRRHPVPR